MALSDLKCFQVTSNSSGVFTATLNVPGRPMNVLTEEVFQELNQILEVLEQDRSVRVAIFRSGKESGFLAVQTFEK